MEKLCGIDEAGRGCVAGPLVMAGVILKTQVDKLNDSKKLTKKGVKSYLMLLLKIAFIILSFLMQQP